MRRWLKRIAVGLSVVVAITLATAAVLAWRATRVPAWYATAVDQTPPDADADAAVKSRLLPLQNWLARTTAGDLDAKPDSEKTYALELAEAEVNAIIAKYLDNVPGEFRTFRTRLTPGRADLGFTWDAQGRTVSVTTDVAKRATGGTTIAQPTIALGGVRVGEQGVPVSWVAGAVGQQVRDRLARRANGRLRIDEHDRANNHTVEAYAGRTLLALLTGDAVSPHAFLPADLSSGGWVATRVTALDVSAGKLNVVFRLLTPDEREAMVAELGAPLPAP